LYPPKPQITLRQESFERLLNNDSLYYEASIKDVIADFNNTSRLVFMHTKGSLQ
jgi:hypothetical protein